jgi:hypothetical protein
MGRPRLYATDAERQAEHRFRQAQRREARERAHQLLRGQCQRLHGAVEAAAAAGQPLAGAVRRPSVEALLEALTTHFEAVAAQNRAPVVPGGDGSTRE